MSYHLKAIEKGKLGEFSKIQEEIAELLDSNEQSNKILIICELCDLLGAIEAYVRNHHSLSLDDLIQMKNSTERAFQLGSRK